MIDDPYNYPIIGVRKVVDGDTVDLVLAKDIGFRVIVQTTQRFRLLNVNTPERGQEGWAEATDFVKSWFAAYGPVARCSSHKTDNFGRWLAYIYVPEDPSTGRPFQSLNDDIISAGHGVVYTR